MATSCQEEQKKKRNVKRKNPKRKRETLGSVLSACVITPAKTWSVEWGSHLNCTDEGKILLSGGRAGGVASVAPGSRASRRLRCLWRRGNALCGSKGTDLIVVLLLSICTANYIGTQKKALNPCLHPCVILRTLSLDNMTARKWR